MLHFGTTTFIFLVSLALKSVRNKVEASSLQYRIFQAGCMCALQRVPCAQKTLWRGSFEQCVCEAELEATLALVCFECVS